jgi:hypothetical protein
MLHCSTWLVPILSVFRAVEPIRDLWCGQAHSTAISTAASPSEYGSANASWRDTRPAFAECSACRCVVVTRAVWGLFGYAVCGGNGIGRGLQGLEGLSTGCGIGVDCAVQA